MTSARLPFLRRLGQCAAIGASFSMIASPALAAPAATAHLRGGLVTTLPGDTALDRGWGGRGGWRGGWGHGHHRDGIDAGDLFAGLLIIGAVAAVASAANSSKDRSVRRDDRNDRNDDRLTDPVRPAEPETARMHDEPSSTGSERDWGRSRSIDGAVDTCVTEVERGSPLRVDSVDALDRDGEGWTIAGRTRSGEKFSCAIDGEGQVRSMTVNGRSPYRT